MKTFLKIVIAITTALCLFPERGFVYQSLWTYFSITIGSAVLLAVVAVFALIKKEKLSFSLLSVLVLLWMGYVFIHTLAFGGDHYRLYMYVGYASLFLFTTFSLKSGILCRNDISGIFFVFGLIEASVCILQALGAVKSANAFFTVTGMFENPNTTAMFLAACLPYDLFVEYKQRRVLGVIGSVLLLTAIVLLQCRTAYIAALVLFCVYFWQIERVKNVVNKHKIVVFGAVVIVLSFGIFLYRFKQASADGRFFVWKVSVGMIAEKPLTGYGYGLFERNYNLAQAEYFRSGKGSEMEKQNADHVNMAYNEYFEQAIEGGAIGLLFYISFLLWTLLLAVKKKDSEAHALILTIVIAGFANFIIQCMPLCLWLFCYSASLDSKIIIGKKLTVVSMAVLTIAFLLNQSKLMLSQFQLKTAIILVKEGKAAQALTLLERNEKNAETSEAYMKYYGKNLLNDKQYDEALLVLKKASCYTSSMDLHFLLSNCYIGMRDSDNAEKSLQTVAHMIPVNLKSRYLLMRFYLLSEQSNKAKIIANEVLEIHPKIVSRETIFYRKEASMVLKNM